MFLVMGLKSEKSNYSCFKKFKKYYCEKGIGFFLFFCVIGVGICCILLSQIYSLTRARVYVCVCVCDNI